MVHIEIPEGAAPLTTLSINHEATVDLDSTNAFEGMSFPTSGIGIAID